MVLLILDFDSDAGEGVRVVLPFAATRKRAARLSRSADRGKQYIA
jgi:hypothetical protein